LATKPCGKIFPLACQMLIFQNFKNPKRQKPVKSERKRQETKTHASCAKIHGMSEGQTHKSSFL